MTTETKTMDISFKPFFDTLRSENIIGINAMKILGDVFSLKLININEFEIDEKANYKKGVPVEYEHIKEFINFNTLVELSKGNESDREKLMTICRKLWKVLKLHKKLGQIFTSDMDSPPNRKKKVTIRSPSTLSKLFTQVNTFVDENENKLRLDFYSHLYMDEYSGTQSDQKTFGQFFTDLIVKIFMVRQVNPKILNDTEFEKMHDPAMGTGGFLIHGVEHLMKGKTEEEQKIIMDYAIKEGVSGNESESDAYQRGLDNTFIYFKDKATEIQYRDSLRNFIVKPDFDTILTNMPFGINNINFGDIGISDEQRKIKNDVFPIEIKESVSLFLQLIIYQLKINGRCSTVYPYGKEVTSTGIYQTLREYLLRTCDVKEIVFLPKNSFKGTGVDTCIWYFQKKKEGTDVLEVTGSKTKKYKFKGSFSTKEVKFYELKSGITLDQVNNANIDDLKIFISSATLSELKENNYSFNSSYYLEDQKYEDTSDVKWINLGNICKLKKGKHSSGKTKTSSSYQYRFITKKRSDIEYCNFFDVDNENVFIYRAFNGNGYFGISFYNGKCAFSNLIYSVQLKNGINTKFFYYWLMTKRLHIQNNMGKGATNKVLDLILFNKIQFPLISIKKQQEIVEQLDFINEERGNTIKDSISQLKRLNKICIENQIRFGDNKIEKLGDILNVIKRKVTIEDDINYKQITVKVKNKGVIIRTYTNGNEIGTKNQFQIKTNDFIFSKIDLRNKAYGIVPDECNDGIVTSDFPVFTINKKTNLKYFKYYLDFSNISDIFVNISSGCTGRKRARVNKVMSIKIPVPSLQKQEEIVSYCESNDSKIKQLEEELEKNKLISSEIISSIFKETVEESDEDSSSDKESDEDSSSDEE